MILHITNCRQADAKLLERIMLEMERGASSRTSSHSMTRDNHSTNQTCFSDFHDDSINDSETQVEWSRETEQLVELLGKILQQVCVFFYVRNLIFVLQFHFMHTL